jgi:hypothetical protein
MKRDFVQYVNAGLPFVGLIILGWIIVNLLSPEFLLIAALILAFGFAALLLSFILGILYYYIEDKLK